MERELGQICPTTITLPSGTGKQDSTHTKSKQGGPMLKVIPRQIIPNSIMTIPKKHSGIHQRIIDNKPQAEATKDSAAIRQGEISRDVSPPIHKEMHPQGPNLRGHQMIPMDQEDQEDPEDPEAHLAGAVHLATAGAARQATHNPEADIM